MKRTLLIPFLACAAGLMPGANAHAQLAQSPALVSSTTTTTGSSAPWEGPGHRHGRGHGGLLERLTDSLSLSGSQQAAIAPILEAAKPQMKAIQENAKAQRDALITSVSGQISPLLTPDQQTKFAELVHKFEAGPEAGAPRHFESPGAEAAESPGGQRDLLKKLTAQLSLTPDQQTQIKPILDAAHAQVQTIRQDTTLTPAQRFAKIRDTMEAARGQINGILTPAQQQQLEDMRLQYHRKPRPAAVPTASPATSGTN